MGREAMDTARCKTCWKELENVLWPLNVIGLLTELAALLEPITKLPLQKKGRTLARPARHYPRRVNMAASFIFTRRARIGLSTLPAPGMSELRTRNAAARVNLAAAGCFRIWRGLD